MFIEKFSQGFPGTVFRHPFHHFEDCLIDFMPLMAFTVFLTQQEQKEMILLNSAGDVSGEQSELLFLYQLSL